MREQRKRRESSEESSNRVCHLESFGFTGQKGERKVKLSEERVTLLDQCK